MRYNNSMATSSRLGGGRNVGVQRSVSAAPEQPAESAGLPKLGGFSWWFTLGILVSIDIGSILISLAIEGLGMAATATAIGAPVGIPIAVLGWIGGVFLTFNALIITIGYLFLNHVPLLQARKLAIWGASAIIEAVPLLSTLPTAALSFAFITFLENTKRGEGILGKVAQKAIAKAGPVGAVAGKVLSKA